MPAPPLDLPVLAWLDEKDDAARLVRCVEEVGAVVRRVSTEEELVAACIAEPNAFVIIGAGASPDRALELCAELRRLEHGEHTTIVVAGIASPSTRSADVLAAGADVGWERDIPLSVIASAVRRAAVRALPRHGELMESSRVLAMMESAIEVMIVVAPDGTIRFANPPVQDMLGIAPAALEHRSLWELIHEDDVHLARSLVDEAVSAHDLVPPSVVRARRHDGSLIEVELAGRSMLDEPAIRGVLLQARDVSERMSVGIALQESEMRFREIFENMLDGLVQIDEDTLELIQANPAFCKIVGYGPQEISNLTLLDLFPAKDRARIAQILDEHSRGERGITEALCILHRDGTVRYVDLGTTRMKLSGIRLLIAVVRDVTRRRETERTRELFLAVVAHELRTPVAVLKNSIQLLKSKTPQASESDRELLVSVLDEEVDRLAKLVADALDVGALQAGNLPLRPRRVALAPIVQSVVGRVAPQFDGKANVKLEPASAFVDPLRFEQVLANILDNAWRHGGGTVIEVALARSEDSARIDVTDQGPGFPAEMRASVFERIFLPNERPTSGIGIGLWLSKRLVVSMGGSIHASSGGDGRGARLTVTVPLLD